MPGLAKFLEVLRLFEPGRPSLTVQEMATALESPPSTVYRHVAELVHAGFLEAGAEAKYRLGPSMPEFDRLARLTDPLSHLGAPAIQRVVQDMGVPCIGVVARLHETKVICVANAAAQDADFGSGYERGEPLPLTRGAASRAILSQLPPRRLAELLQQADRRDEAPDTLSLRTNLAEIRLRGIASCNGELVPGLVGFAVPVTSAPLRLIGSMGVAMRTDTADRTQQRRHVATLVMAASALSLQMAAELVI